MMGFDACIRKYEYLIVMNTSRICLSIGSWVASHW